MVICHLSLVICHWSLVIGHWSLVILSLLPIPQKYEFSKFGINDRLALSDADEYLWRSR
ncbi:hypothetical protein [Nostoc sp. CHAB 5836]|uniref:hypothetical protein n=1 Tax=Nostoc sp. CHAB 5836 TaxID=2780404 RepID=UPI001E553E3D|nr:hypothetical protein [Nostoc sp. CHAB 5836]